MTPSVVASSAKPEPTLELIREDGHWQIMNVALGTATPLFVRLRKVRANVPLMPVSDMCQANLEDSPAPEAVSLPAVISHTIDLLIQASEVEGFKGKRIHLLRAINQATSPGTAMEVAKLLSAEAITDVISAATEEEIEELLGIVATITDQSTEQFVAYGDYFVERLPDIERLPVFVYALLLHRSVRHSRRNSNPPVNGQESPLLQGLSCLLPEYFGITAVRSSPFQLQSDHVAKQAFVANLYRLHKVLTHERTRSYCKV